MPRKLSTFAVDSGRSLIGWLADRLGLDADDLRARLAAGAILVDGRRVRGNLILRAGQRIVVNDPPPADRPLAWRVAFEDDVILIVDKPAGLAVQAERGAGGALDEQVQARHPSARLLHRIDRDTSGLVLFTLRDATRARWQEILERGELVREYVAFVDGDPPWDEITLDRPIGRDPRDRRRQQAGHGDPARTLVSVERRARLRDAAQLRARLDTGRTHQIRVHLADAGFAILGDPIYAPPIVRARAPRLALHAARLAWPGGVAEAPVPPELAVLV